MFIDFLNTHVEGKKPNGAIRLRFYLIVVIDNNLAVMAIINSLGILFLVIYKIFIAEFEYAGV